MIALSLSRSWAWLAARGLYTTATLGERPALDHLQQIALRSLSEPYGSDLYGSKGYAALAKLGPASAYYGTTPEQLRTQAPYEHVLGVAQVLGVERVTHARSGAWLGGWELRLCRAVVLPQPVPAPGLSWSWHVTELPVEQAAAVLAALGRRAA